MDGKDRGSQQFALCWLLNPLLSLAKIIPECLLYAKHWGYKRSLKEPYRLSRDAQNLTTERGIRRRWPSESMFLTLFYSQFSFWSEVNIQRVNRQCLEGTLRPGVCQITKEEQGVCFFHHGARWDSLWPVIKEILSLWFGVRTENFVALLRRGVRSWVPRILWEGLLYRSHREADLRAPGQGQ